MTALDWSLLAATHVYALGVGYWLAWAGYGDLPQEFSSWAEAFLWPFVLPIGYARKMRNGGRKP